jgi:Gylcosyl hydrolase family 115 C-terminal domain
VDGNPETIVDAWSSNTDADWQRAVSDGVHKVTTNLGLIERGSHVLHFCRVDAGVVLERLLINAGPPTAEYLGPPESKRAATLFLR